jgi:hypothetical protein
MSTRKNQRPVHIKTFKSMNSKPATPKKGVAFFVEPIKSMTNDPTIKGDVFKKFVNGKLVKQVFVSKNRMKKIIATAKKSRRNYGGRVTRRPYPRVAAVRAPAMRPRRAAQPVYVNQPPPQGQLPAQQIYAADNTSMGQAATQGLAGGVGFFAAQALVEGVVDALTGK